MVGSFVKLRKNPLRLFQGHFDRLSSDLKLFPSKANALPCTSWYKNVFLIAQHQNSTLWQDPWYRTPSTLSLPSWNMHILFMIFPPKKFCFPGWLMEIWKDENFPPEPLLCLANEIFNNNWPPCTFFREIGLKWGKIGEEINDPPAHLEWPWSQVFPWGFISV